MRQLKRVLNNLHQLARLVEEEKAPRRCCWRPRSTIRFTEDAVRAAASRPDAALGPLIGTRLVDAGARTE